MTLRRSGSYNRGTSRDELLVRGTSRDELLTGEHDQVPGGEVEELEDCKIFRKGAGTTSWYLIDKSQNHQP